MNYDTGIYCDVWEFSEGVRVGSGGPGTAGTVDLQISDRGKVAPATERARNLWEIGIDNISRGDPGLSRGPWGARGTWGGDRGDLSHRP